MPSSHLVIYTIKAVAASIFTGQVVNLQYVWFRYDLV